MVNKSSDKSFCALAWVHSFVNLGGEYQVCCTSEEFENNILDNNGNKINIMDGFEPSEIMNTNYMKELRLKMLEGKWDALCGRCLITEKNNGVSRRMIENKGYEDLIPSLLEATNTDGTINVDINSADYRLGNICNLQCRMCNPRSTLKWIDEWNEIKPENEKFAETNIEEFRSYDWFDRPELIKDFRLKAPTLKHLHFAGGEPLIVPQMRKILQECINSGNAKNITITYNTNLSVLPEKVIELWKHFRGVKLLISVDAVGDLNNYIRYPANWSDIDNNLKRIDKEHKELNIKEALISTTVQILNISRIDELVDYLAQFSFIMRVPNLINLHVPNYFQSTVLPENLKIKTTQKLLKLAEKAQGSVNETHRYLIDNIRQVVSFMNSEKNYEERFPIFLKFQSDFDKKRNINLYDHCPELQQYSTSC